MAVVDDKERSVLIFVRRDKEGNKSSLPVTLRRYRVMIIASALSAGQMA